MDIDRDRSRLDRLEQDCEDNHLAGRNRGIGRVNTLSPLLSLTHSYMEMDTAREPLGHRARLDCLKKNCEDSHLARRGWWG